MNADDNNRLETAYIKFARGNFVGYLFILVKLLKNNTFYFR